MFSLISAWINGWVNNRQAGDLRRNRTHYDVSVKEYFMNAISADVNLLVLTQYRVDHAVILGAF